MGLSACGPSVKSVVEKHRKMAEYKLGALEDVGRLAKSEPPLAGAKIVLTGAAPDFGKSESPTWNAGVMHLEDFDDLTVESRAPLRLSHDPFWHWGTACLLRKGVWTSGDKLKYPETAERSFLDLERVQYVLVIRTLEHRPPKVTSQDGDSAFFDPGVFVGEGFVYEIAPRKLVCSFRFEARSQEQVRTRATSVQSDLESYLGIQAQKAIRENLAGLMPGTTGP